MMGWLMNSKLAVTVRILCCVSMAMPCLVLKRCVWKQSSSNLRNCAGVCLEALKKTMNISIRKPRPWAEIWTQEFPIIFASCILLVANSAVNPLGNYTVVSELLKCGYRSLEAKNQEGQTAVHLASRMGKDDILKKLIESGANINCRDTAGYTPLHVSTWV
jgi:ankyrin repeat protein